jgi:hypothetical protein
VDLPLKLLLPDAPYAGDEPTYRPTPQRQHTARARLRWLPPEGARGKALGCIVGPAAATKQWDSTAAAMLGQMKRWSKLALSYAGRSYVLTAYVWSRGMTYKTRSMPPQQT